MEKFKVIIKNRITQEATNLGEFESLESANDWIAGQESKPKPWGRYHHARDVPKKGMGYENEEDYNDRLVIKGSEYHNHNFNQTWLKLNAEYGYEILDQTNEYQAYEADKLAKKQAKANAKSFLVSNRGNMGNMSVPELNECVTKILDYLELS